MASAHNISKKMISTIAGPEGENLLSSLTSLANLSLSGDIPSSVRPIFFGASLTILNKKAEGLGLLPLAAPFGVWWLN